MRQTDTESRALKSGSKTQTHITKMNTENPPIEETAEERCQTLREIFGEPIHTVTRAQLLADGSLIDVSEMAKSYGIRLPVAMTALAFGDTVAWSEADDERKAPLSTGQSESGRLMDVCCMLRHAMVNTNVQGNRLTFRLHRIPREGKGVRAREVELQAICGPADDGSPCITVLALGED